MKSINRWFYRWKLRRVVAALARRTNVPKRQEAGVLAFARMLEGTEIMSRGVKKSDKIPLECTREELDQFIRYMTTLHDSRLSLLIRARIGLATLAMTDKQVLGQEPVEVLKDEHAKALVGHETTLVSPSGKPMRIKL